MAHEMGTEIAIPFMFLSFICLAAIPAYAITDCGFIDVVQQKVIRPHSGGRGIKPNPPKINLQKSTERSNMNNDFFKLKDHGTTVRREVLAGITTFMTMAYVLAVQPSAICASAPIPTSRI